MQLETLVNRCCALQCETMQMIGDDLCNVEIMSFTFMLWDHVACDVRMGCIGGVEKGELLFMVGYDSPVCGKRLFMGVPWVVDCLPDPQGRKLALSDTVGEFLCEMGKTKIGTSNTDVVFDGDLSVDKPVSLHLHFDCVIDGKTLLVKDVAECDNILLVIDMFK